MLLRRLEHQKEIEFHNSMLQYIFIYLVSCEICFIPSCSRPGIGGNPPFGKINRT